ncbi:hypothetical protein GOP47_0001364 [Adiantum capillus-veneris]|uniref:Uncharacterized protein n=1 Tax=Adiantum capillus-veneris TaxID=13818 RepID=A0A9D4V9D4_ADICA|nr:hypothetical protein GOP47_0001364 [Adiantum capillus-veneris]
MGAFMGHSYGDLVLQPLYHMPLQAYVLQFHAVAHPPDNFLMSAHESLQSFFDYFQTGVDGE